MTYADASVRIRKGFDRANPNGFFGQDEIQVLGAGTGCHGT